MSTVEDVIALGGIRKKETVGQCGIIVLILRETHRPMVTIILLKLF